jgi:hypothetical protein
VYLDYERAFGFGKRWDDGASGKCVPAPQHPVVLREIDRDRLDDMIRQIEAMDEAKVAEIVTRIPSTHLDPSEVETIVSGLCQRRTLIRSALAPFLSGGAKP